MVLLHYLKWLKENTSIGITILLKKGGELESDFEKVAPTVHWNTKIRNKFFSKKLAHKIQRRIFGVKAYMSLPEIMQHKKFDLIYLNTIDAIDQGVYLKEIFNCPIVCHVHENEYTLKNGYPGVLSETGRRAISHYIAVSESTKDNLVQNFGIAAGDITIFNEFIPVQEMKKATVGKEKIKSDLGLNGEFIVGGSGISSWRKGTDLFIRLAKELNTIEPNNSIKLMWVGKIDDSFQDRYNYEKSRLNLADKIIFTGQQDQPQNYFQLFDVFTLTSREDPFPLVCLEAAALAKPVICFKDSGGMVEFLKDVDELIVPYADVRSMAKTILKLQKDPSYLMNLGVKVQERVMDFDVEKVAPRLHQLILSMMLN